MKRLKPRSELDCQTYMKPGVNFKEELQRGRIRCGCPMDPIDPNDCTGIDMNLPPPFSSGAPPYYCNLSADCKNVIQGWEDMWGIEWKDIGKIKDKRCLDERITAKVMSSYAKTPFCRNLKL